ncbi:MAG: glycosyltransferase family 4 protein [Sedimentisphaerales bacterium]|nr:glycosyltransferase family 4 protein [Sedimentisphaerales bacterium]
MIKTAVIIERADIALGGAERSVFELTSQLSLMGIDVTTFAATGDIQADNFKILFDQPKTKRISFKNFEKTLKDHFKKNNFDIIHSTLPFDFADVYQPRGGSYKQALIQNAASYDNAFISKVKMASHFLNFKRTALLKAEKTLCTSGKATIAALSNYVRSQFVNHYRMDEERIHVIPNGIKINITPDTKKAEGIRRHIFQNIDLTEADEPVIFLFAANNFRLKGLTPLLKAIAASSKDKKQRPVCLAVAGSGNPAKYRLFAKTLNIHSKVVFLGTLPHIRDTLSACDVAALPTWYDPCSRFVLEALSMNKPVITTAFNGASEVIANNVHGRIVDRPDNLDSLLDAINYFRKTHNIASASQAIITDNIKEKISIAKHADRLIELYKTILDKR